jgi:hypothetical protein
MQQFGKQQFIERKAAMTLQTGDNFLDVEAELAADVALLKSGAGPKVSCMGEATYLLGHSHAEIRRLIK